MNSATGAVVPRSSSRRQRGLDYLLGALFVLLDLTLGWPSAQAHAQSEAGQAPDSAPQPPSGAAPSGDGSSGSSGSSELSPADARVYRALSAPGGIYARVLGSMSFGRGLRFNNPYRLDTQLGARPEAVSLTAPYMDLAAGVTLGPPDGLQHGGMLRLSVALEGVPQEAFSFGYLALYRADSPWMAYGRLGGVWLSRPQSNVGAELGIGGAYFVTGALGVTADLVGNLYYGAGTYEVKYSVVPTLSMSAGIIVDFEVLP